MQNACTKSELCETLTCAILVKHERFYCAAKPPLAHLVDVLHLKVCELQGGDFGSNTLVGMAAERDAFGIE